MEKSANTIACSTCQVQVIACDYLKKCENTLIFSIFTFAIYTDSDPIRGGARGVALQNLLGHPTAAYKNSFGLFLANFTE